MKMNKLLATIFSMTLLMLSFSSQSQINCNHEMIECNPKKKSSTSGVLKFCENFDQYAYDGDGLDVINIKRAELQGSKLTIEYYYTAEGENRKGKSSHKLQSDGIYKGHWKTIADNGNTYEGESWFKFNSDGTASGNWTWDGVPGEFELAINKIKLYK